MDVCRICGLGFSNASYGGPGICPSCDCGIQPVEAQRKEILRLHALVADIQRETAIDYDRAADALDKLRFNASRYQWLTANADRCASFVADIYTDWDTDTDWRDVLNRAIDAEIAEQPIDETRNA